MTKCRYTSLSLCPVSKTDADRSLTKFTNFYKPSGNNNIYLVVIERSFINIAQ